jgi:hypothetical protein
LHAAAAEKSPARFITPGRFSGCADEKIYGGGDQLRQYSNVIIFGATFRVSALQPRARYIIDFSNKCNLQLLHVVCHSPDTKCIYGISFISLSDERYKIKIHSISVHSLRLHHERRVRERERDRNTSAGQQTTNSLPVVLRAFLIICLAQGTRETALRTSRMHVINFARLSPNRKLIFT